MAVFNLDFSNVASREPLEPGWYRCAIATVESRTATTGSPMLAVSYRVISDSDGELVPGTRKVFENWVLTESALWKIYSVFTALGLASDAIVEMDTDELVGMELMLKIEQEMYNGEVRNCVKGAKAL